MISITINGCKYDVNSDVDIYSNIFEMFKDQLKYMHKSAIVELIENIRDMLIEIDYAGKATKRITRFKVLEKSRDDIIKFIYDIMLESSGCNTLLGFGLAYAEKGEDGRNVIKRRIANNPEKLSIVSI